MNTIAKHHNNSTPNDFLLALLLYLPTLYFMPAAGNLLAILFFLFFSRQQPVYRRDIFLVIFIIAALINMTIGLPKHSDGRLEVLFSVLFIFPCVWIGRSLNHQILKYFLFFTLLECLIVLYEVANHQTVLFANQLVTADETAISSLPNDLFYYFRPFGLSSNSSIISLKIFVAILITLFLFDRIKFPKSTLTGLYLSCALTFNRTVMGIALALGFYIYMKHVFSIRRSGGKILLHLMVISTVVIVTILLWNDAIFQITRGGGSTSMLLAGRPEIWSAATSFISEHPFLGNNSFSFRVMIEGKLFHCHNSFLQLYATHGVIGLILLIYITLKIRYKNLLFILPIIIFSLTQYGVFWNFSYLDVIFYFFLDWNESRLGSASHGRDVLANGSLSQLTIA